MVVQLVSSPDQILYLEVWERLIRKPLSRVTNSVHLVEQPGPGFKPNRGFGVPMSKSHGLFSSSCPDFKVSYGACVQVRVTWSNHKFLSRFQGLLLNWRPPPCPNMASASRPQYGVGVRCSWFGAYMAHLTLLLSPFVRKALLMFWYLYMIGF